MTSPEILQCRITESQELAAAGPDVAHRVVSLHRQFDSNWGVERISRRHRRSDAMTQSRLNNSP
jgi:hypothetical protein